MSKKFGIDVSSHNGNINFNSIKNHIDFCLIRCGYGNNETRQDDTYYIKNINECEKLNIPYGIYLYSYALNLNEAKSEVEHVKRLLKNTGKNFKYGIWFDMEDGDNYKKRIGMPSNDMLVSICYYFCENIEKLGYYTGIYASLDWLNTKLNNSKLDRFDKWVAQWNSECNYNKVYSIWQFTDKYEIDGKKFDGNYLIRDFVSSTNSNKLKDLNTIADEVINGLWGNGEERKNKLTKAGYNYNEVQNIVNSKLKNNKTNIESIAKDVISGKYGNGETRKNKLGSLYSEVQKRVNEILRGK